MQNATLNYAAEGEGRPLLILHGLFGSSLNWKTHARELAKSQQVLRVDMRNHGESFHSPEMTYPDMAADILQLLDHLNLAKVSILGHSMGGKAAMTFAHLHPDRVERLIIADMAPLAYTHDYDEIFEPLLGLDLSTVTSRKQADESLKTSIPETLLRQFLLQNLSIRGGLAEWKINLTALSDNVEKITGFGSIDGWHIQRPTLFLRGELSNYLPADKEALVLEHFPNARIQTLQGAGHWLHFERPKAFLQAVREFLAE